MRGSLPFLLAAVLGAGMLPSSSAAQAPAAATLPPRVQYVRVEGADYAFMAPPTIRPGITVFHLVNVGTDLHAMTVLSIPPSRTVKEFLDLFKSTGKTPAWASVLGESGTIKPGKEGFVTTRLVPGRYILACFLPAADGRSHSELGMVQLVTAK